MRINDRYPSTDDEQSVHLQFPYPDADHELTCGLPLVKWLLAIPRYVLLFFLTIAAFLSAILMPVRGPVHRALPTPPV